MLNLCMPCALSMAADRLFICLSKASRASRRREKTSQSLASLANQARSTLVVFVFVEKEEKQIKVGDANKMGKKAAQERK